MIGLDVAIGVADTLEEAAASALARWAYRPARRVGRALGDTPSLVRRHWDELGASGVARRRRAGQSAAAAIAAAGTAWPVNLVIDAQLARLLPGVVAEVLAQLEGEPDRIRALVRGQRETIVDEVVGRVRAGAAAGDEAVDRFTVRMTHRNGGSDPPGRS